MKKPETNTFKRLKQYRVDFAYSKYQYFAASARIKKEYEKQRKQRRTIDFLIAFSTTVTFIGILDLIEYVDIVSGIFSLAGLFFALVQIVFHTYEPNYIEYKSTANEYLYLYKKAKNLEAKWKDNLISDMRLSEEIDNLHHEQERILTHAPKTEDIDYKEAQERIKRGEQSYTEDDFSNT